MEIIKYSFRFCIQTHIYLAREIIEKKALDRSTIVEMFVSEELAVCIKQQLTGKACKTFF